jgi:hypothetical protein
LFGVMPHHSCASELRDGTLQAVRIGERGLHANALLVTSGRRLLTNAARAVVGVIPSLVRSLIKDGVWTEGA